MTDDGLKRFEKEFGLIETPAEKAKKYIPYIVSSLCLIFIIASFIASMEKPGIVGLAAYDGGEDGFAAKEIVEIPFTIKYDIFGPPQPECIYSVIMTPGLCSTDFGGYPCNGLPYDGVTTAYLPLWRWGSDKFRRLEIPDVYSGQYACCNSTADCNDLHTAPLNYTYTAYYSGYGGEAMYPAFVVRDFNGTYHIVWQVIDENLDYGFPDTFERENWNIYYSQSSNLTDGTNWTEPLQISDRYLYLSRGDRSDIFPDIAVGKDGVVHIVWQSNRFNSSLVNYDWHIFMTNCSLSNDCTKQSSWSPPVMLDNATIKQSDGFDDINPSIDVDLNNMPHIVWQSNRFSESPYEEPGNFDYRNFSVSHMLNMSNWDWDIMYTNYNMSLNTSVDGSSVPVEIRENVSDEFPDIVATYGSSTDLHLVWHAESGSPKRYRVFYENTTDIYSEGLMQLNWTNSPTKINDSSQAYDDMFPQIDANLTYDGSISVVWQSDRDDANYSANTYPFYSDPGPGLTGRVDVNDSNWTIYRSDSSDYGASWNTSNITDNSSSSMHPVIAVDEYNKVHIAYQKLVNRTALDWEIFYVNDLNLGWVVNTSKNSSIDSYPTLDTGMVGYDNNKYHHRHPVWHSDRSNIWSIYYENAVPLMPTDLEIEDETDTQTIYDYSQIKFYANYTSALTGETLYGNLYYCLFSENSSGSWSTPVAMTFNSTSGLYEYNRAFSNTGAFNFNVSCHAFILYEDASAASNFAVTDRGTITYTEFDSVGTTNFDTIPDPNQVLNAVLENPDGKIVWLGPVNIVDQDFDSNVQINKGFIEVTPESLHLSFNSSATLSLYGLDVVYAVILKDGEFCESDCTDISHVGGDITFDVSHFTNFTVIEGTNLSLWDTTDYRIRYEYQEIRFYANYSNITSKGPIYGGGVYCKFSENSSGSWSTPVNMMYDGSSKLYWQNASFTKDGIFHFNVTCNGSSLGYAVLNLTDSFNITHDAIPPNITLASIVSGGEENRSDEDISCSMGATDNVRMKMIGYYSWYRNDSYNRSGIYYPIDNGTPREVSTIGSSQIRRNETWTCGVQAQDWFQNSTELNSSTMKIRNALPKTKSLVVNATTPYIWITDELFCWVLGYDKDEDNLIADFQWYNGSVPVLGFNGSLPLNGTTLISNISSNMTDYDEIWTCSVRLFDGFENESQWHNASIWVTPKKIAYSAEELAPDVSAFEPVTPAGVTTNFSINNLIIIELQTIENYTGAVLRNDYGMMQFLDPANYSKLNLTKHINISQNNFSINLSGSMSRLINVSAEITLFNLTLVYPELYKNGAGCEDCTLISYLGDRDLLFRVPGFDILPITTYYGIELAPDVSVFNEATDFGINSIADIANVSGLFVRNNSAGKIRFLEPINATNLNLSKHIILTYRNASIDTSDAYVAYELNKPAEITLYNVNLTYPIILKNGVRCPKSNCSFIYYSPYPFLFNVTGFDSSPMTSYAVKEGAPNITLFNGSTTDFSRLGPAEFDFDIENISNIVLEKQGLGKIGFLEPINVSAGNLDWNSYVDIINNGYSGKYVSINTTELPNLNKSANITLYDLGLVFPAILYINSSGDKELCPETVCKIISYSSQPQNCKTNKDCTLIFNITDFRSENYWAMENDTAPKFIYPIPDQIWYENKNQTIYSLAGYVFDPDNETLIYSVVLDCSPNITAYINQTTTNAVFVPDSNWTGACTAEFNVSDGNSSAYWGITLTVIANIPPQFINGPITALSWAEDTNLTINLSYYFWDPDNDTLEYGYQFYTTENIDVHIDQETGIAILEPDDDWYGQNFIRFWAEDEKTRTYTLPYTTLTINSVNDIPSLDINIPDNTKSYITIDEDTNTSIYLPNHFSDVEDNDADLIYHLNSTPENFDVIFDGIGNVKFVPDTNWNGYESFIILANDSDGGTGQSNQFVIYVTAVPDAVQLLNATVYLEWVEETNLSINVSDWFYDPDNDSIFYYEQSPTSQITVNLNPFTGEALLIPAADFTGTDTINFSATDGFSTATATATLNVTNTYDPPSLGANIPDMVWDEDTNETFDLDDYFVDPDYTGLTYDVALNASNINALIDNTTGVVTLVPDSDWYGSDTIRFNATDINGSSAESNDVNLHVVSINDAPISQTIPQLSWIKNTNLTINLLDYFYDVDGDPLNFTATDPDNITIHINNTAKTATLEPDTNFTDTNNATFTAYDPDGESVTSNLVILEIVEGPSILINTSVDGDFYEYENTSRIDGIIVSNLTESNVTSSSITGCLINDSTIINSTLTGCTVINSFVKNYIGSGCIINDSTVDPPSQNDITGSNITGGSTLYNSNVTYSDIYNSTITNSNGTGCTVKNAYLRNCQFNGALCNIVDWQITGGFIIFDGNTYDTTINGTENLTGIINYPPIADFTAPSSAQPGTNITFTSTSKDYNIPETNPGVPGEGLLNDNLTFFWDFNDTTTSTLENATHSYASEGTYAVSLTVTDKFGESNTTTKTITVQTPAPPRRGGGGGGAAVEECEESWNCTEWEPCTPYGIQYRTCIDMNQCGTFYFRPIGDQACEYTPTCSDFVINQNETDVDCGGSCPPCADGKTCLTDADCVNSCIESVCTAPPPVAVVLPPPPPPLPPPVERPARVSLWQREIFGIGLWVYILAVMAATVLVAGGIFVSKKKAKKIEEIPTYSYIDALKTAIRRDITRGVPEEDLRKALLDVGWPKHIVDKAIRETNKDVLEEPVKSDIAKGYDELKLKQALAQKGWPISTVDEAIEDINLSILRNAMKNNIPKGFGADKIGKGMIEKGWPEDIVDKVVKEFRPVK